MRTSIKDSCLCFCFGKINPRWTASGNQPGAVSFAVSPRGAGLSVSLCWRMLDWLEKYPLKLGKSFAPRVLWQRVKSSHRNTRDETRLCLTKLILNWSIYLIYSSGFCPDEEKQQATQRFCVIVGSRTPGHSCALHLPACSQCKLLPAHHLHARQILFKCLHLHRGAFQNRYPQQIMH